MNEKIKNDYKFEEALIKEKDVSLGKKTLDDIIDNFTDNNTGKLNTTTRALCPECQVARLSLINKKFLRLYSSKDSIHTATCSYKHEVASGREMEVYNTNEAIPNPEKISRKLASFFANKSNEGGTVGERGGRGKAPSEVIENPSSIFIVNEKTRKIAQQKIGLKSRLDEFEEGVYKYFYGEVHVEVVKRENNAGAIFYTYKIQSLNRRNKNGNYSYIFELMVGAQKKEVIKKLSGIESDNYKLGVYGKIQFKPYNG
ncbi:hypothetical protein, partial [Lactococcus taiwanensis]|uniref:hypothetical protein n=1 Tax=Lactococcus taiwanensis TaxID=1151742 RepID=UPI0023F55489